MPSHNKDQYRLVNEIRSLTIINQVLHFCVLVRNSSRSMNPRLVITDSPRVAIIQIILELLNKYAPKNKVTAVRTKRPHGTCD